MNSILIEQMDALVGRRLRYTMSTSSALFDATSKFLMALNKKETLEVLAHIFTYGPGGKVDLAIGLMAWIYTVHYMEDKNSLSPEPGVGAIRNAVRDLRYTPFDIVRKRRVREDRYNYESVEIEYLKIMKSQAERGVFFSEEDPEYVTFKKEKMDPLWAEMGQRYELSRDTGEV